MLDRFEQAMSLGEHTVAFRETLLSWRYPVDAHALPFEDGSFDLCISNAVFEHLHDPALAAHEIARVLDKDGLGIHQIDFRDHRDFTKPLEFLKASSQDWQRLFSKNESFPQELGPRRMAYQFTNRWRKNDFRRAFEAAHTPVTYEDVNMKMVLSEELKNMLHSDFKGRPQEDLEALSALFATRKPLATLSPGS
jgi:SAM-dependent methyltransferase